MFIFAHLGTGILCKGRMLHRIIILSERKRVGLDKYMCLNTSKQDRRVTAQSLDVFVSQLRYDFSRFYEGMDTMITAAVFFKGPRQFSS